MKSEQIGLLLRHSKEREKRFKELNAPQPVIDREKEIQRGLYKAKIIDYRVFVSRLMERMRCFLL